MFLMRRLVRLMVNIITVPTISAIRQVVPVIIILITMRVMRVPVFQTQPARNRAAMQQVHLHAQMVPQRFPVRQQQPRHIRKLAQDIALVAPVEQMVHLHVLDVIIGATKFMEHVQRRVVVRGHT